MTGDAQLVIPMIALRARIVAEERPELAAELVDELGTFSERGAASLPHAWFLDAVEAARMVGKTELLEELAARAPTTTTWMEAGLLLLRDDPEAAAAIFREMGARPDEAHAHVRAAERLVAEGRTAEADVELAPALAFYREVGATAFARRAEALLRESA